MKQFNLEEAKKGARVVTRDGRSVRLICTDMKHPEYSLVGLISSPNSSEEYLASFSEQGKYLKSDNSKMDLFLEKDKEYIGIMKDNELDTVFLTSRFKSKETLERVASTNYLDHQHLVSIVEI